MGKKPGLEQLGMLRQIAVQRHTGTTAQHSLLSKRKTAMEVARMACLYLKPKPAKAKKSTQRGR